MSRNEKKISLKAERDMDLFREHEIANDDSQTAGKGMDNNEIRLESLRHNPVAETTIRDLLKDIEGKMHNTFDYSFQLRRNFIVSRVPITA